MIKYILNIFKKIRKSKEEKIYVISSEIIKYTERVLHGYANRHPSNEGLVYWAGRVLNNTISITAVI